MSIEQKKVESLEAEGIREGMRDVSNFRLAGSITQIQFNEQAYSLRDSIIKLLEKDDSSAKELAEKFKANFPYHSEGL